MIEPCPFLPNVMNELVRCLAKLVWVGWATKDAGDERTKHAKLIEHGSTGAPADRKAESVYLLTHLVGWATTKDSGYSC